MLRKSTAVQVLGVVRSGRRRTNAADVYLRGQSGRNSAQTGHA
jgi:hypothetical protein